MAKISGSQMDKAFLYLRGLKPGVELKHQTVDGQLKDAGIKDKDVRAALAELLQLATDRNDGDGPNKTELTGKEFVDWLKKFQNVVKVKSSSDGGTRDGDGLMSLVMDMGHGWFPALREDPDVREFVDSNFSSKGWGTHGDSSFTPSHEELEYLEDLKHNKAD